MAAILKQCREKVGKTRIVYGASLNHKFLCEYLDDLERHGMVQKFEDGRIQATEKGKTYLKYYEGFMQFTNGEKGS